MLLHGQLHKLRPNTQIFELLTNSISFYHFIFVLADSTQWESHRLNNQIFSFFLYDLFSFLPIEYIFSEIKNYWNKVSGFGIHLKFIDK